MKRSDNKSDCPVNISLETFGDSWSLLIVRDIIFWGKKTYKDFLESGERIATNILASRLEQLEQKGLLHKKSQGAKRGQIYTLTEKGLDLIPIVIEMSVWGARHSAHATMYKSLAEKLYANRDQTLRKIRKGVAEGASIFGSNAISLD